MKPKYTDEQIKLAIELRKQGIPQKQISEQIGIKIKSLGTIYFRCDEPPKKKVKSKPGKQPHIENRILSMGDKLKILEKKKKKAQQRIDTAKPGDKITVMYPASKGYQAVSGEVETKYPDKLLIRDGKGRPQTITFADLLTYKVVEG